MTEDDRYDYELGGSIEAPPNRTFRYLAGVVLLGTVLLGIAEPAYRWHHEQVMQEAIRIAANVRTPDPDWVWRETRPTSEGDSTVALVEAGAGGWAEVTCSSFPSGDGTWATTEEPKP